MPRIHVDATLYIWLALGLLLLPIPWLLAAIAAAGFHELCHWAAAKWRKVFWYGMTVDPAGMIMHMGGMTEKDVLLVSAAGPVGSLLLGCLARVWPQIAVCGMVQGLYNLLPVYPLDGGRILRSMVGDSANWVEGVCVLLIFTGGIIAADRTELGISALFIALLVCCRAIQRKFPCKEAVIGVQ